MKRALVLALLAACNDPGLLLEVHAGSDAPMASVEVMIPDGMRMNGMGMPPMQSPRTPGNVYEVIETTQADVSDGTAKVLLQAGSLDAFPALLVLGHDAGGAITGYALITDPNSSDGLIHVRHTASDEIVVHLDPIAQVPVAQGRQPMASDALVRWDTAGDAPDGRCVGIIHANGKGDFFGPDGDKDCDAADPECDDSWFLKSTGAGKCATQTPPADDDTMDACRVGSTLGCTDNVTKDGACTAAAPGLCTPVTLCDHCQGLINNQCIGDAVADGKTAHVECTVYYTNEAGTPRLCAGGLAGIDMMGTFFGPTYGCVGPSGFADFTVMAQTMPSIPLVSTGDSMTFNCHQLGLEFSVVGNAVTLDPSMSTPGTIYFGVGDMTSSATAPSHFLALPFVASFQSIVACPPSGLLCELVEGDDSGQPFFDPMWHCAGN